MVLRVFGERSRKGEFMDGFVGSVFESFFREVLFGKIAKGTVWIFGRILIFPWFVGLIVLFTEHSLELVLTCVDQKLH